MISDDNHHRQAGCDGVFEELPNKMAEMRVHVTSVTDLWAGMAITGPQARQLLGNIITDIDFSQKAFPLWGCDQAISVSGVKK